MNLLPQRRSLAAQLSDILAEAMRARRWGDWLPEERELARQFQVSRFTLRRALEMLREQGWLETRHGVGTRITGPSVAAARPAAPAPPASIGLLLPRALERFRYFATLVVDDLKTLLFDRGQSLLVHEHPQVEASRPVRLLAKLVEQHRHACWLLMGCSLETQRWFARNRVPAVVSGTTDASLGLPFVWLDNHALGRHAALTLVQHGHRRIGALLTHSNPALRAGLDEVMRATSATDAVLTVTEIDETTDAAARAIDRLVALKRPPTALFIAESSLYLSAFCQLTQRGWRVPADISLLCRDDEPYLASVLPSPARYTKSPHRYAKLLLGCIEKVIAREPVALPGAYLMPEFRPGDSLRRV